jgi:hypothetical protein
MSAVVAPTIRRLTDVNLQVSHVLPAAAANVSSAGIDLGSVTLGPAADDLEGVISVDATPSLADAKTILAVVQDSADNVTFAPLAGVGILTQTGAGGIGSIAGSLRFKFPPATRRYVNVNAAVLAAGGDNTAASFNLKIYASS